MCQVRTQEEKKYLYIYIYLIQLLYFYVECCLFELFYGGLVYLNYFERTLNNILLPLNYFRYISKHFNIVTYFLNPK